MKIKIGEGHSSETDIDGYPMQILEDFVTSKLFLKWVERFNSASFTIKRIDVISIDWHPNGNPLFAKLNVEAYNKTGKRIVPSMVFLRGDSVAILPILIAEETAEKYVIFTRQIRLPIGEDDFVEIPAGMLDGSGDFCGVAAKEIHEETGLVIKVENLVSLAPEEFWGTIVKAFPPRAVAVSPGACDECMAFFLFEKKMPLAEILAMQDKLTGNAAEHEYIRLMVVPFERAYKMTRDGKFFTAIALAALHGKIKI